jgi:hypothetical protein
LTALIATALSLLVMSACGLEGASTPTCAETLCEAGETRCLGSVLATCELLDGEGEPPRWSYIPCGPSGACGVEGGGQSCLVRDCHNLGGGTCDPDPQAIDTQTITICDVSGLTSDTYDCGADEVCTGGTCAPTACEDGETRCGATSVLTCADGHWEESGCGEDAICADDSGEAVCELQICAPESAWCDEGVAHVCNYDGSARSEAPCGEMEVCNSGFCEPLLCNGKNNIDPGNGLEPTDVLDDDTDGDAAEFECEPGATKCLDGDSLDTCEEGFWLTANCGQNQICGEVDGVDACKAKAAPPLETIPAIKFTLGGVPNVFDLNARADYISAESMLKVSGASGTRKIELNFVPIETLIVGAFSDTDTSETVLQVCYFDGLEPVEKTPGCAVGFSHSSTLYDAVIDQWNGIGSAVIGTFEVTLETASGSTLAITDGVFDVKQK